MRIRELFRVINDPIKNRSIRAIAMTVPFSRRLSLFALLVIQLLVFQPPEKLK